MNTHNVTSALSGSLITKCVLYCKHDWIFGTYYKIRKLGTEGDAYFETPYDSSNDSVQENCTSMSELRMARVFVTKLFYCITPLVSRLCYICSLNMGRSVIHNFPCIIKYEYIFTNLVVFALYVKNSLHPDDTSKNPCFY
jgi:hypothetical protein